MKIVNIHDAKTQLSKLLVEVENGEEIVIGRYGEPVAKLVSYTGERPKYKFGLLKGKLRLEKGFDEILA